MDVKGIVYLFPKKVGKEEKEGVIFETTLNRKEGDNYVDSFTLQVDFAKELLTDEAKKKYDSNKVYKFEIVEGFLTTRSWTDKDGKKHTAPKIKVTKAKRLDEGRPVNRKEKVEEDLGLDLDL